MIEIKGYRKVTYNQLQSILNTLFEESGKTHVDIAAEIKVASANTVKNALKFDKQVASDTALTKVMAALKLQGAIIYTSGTQHYYIRH